MNKKNQSAVYGLILLIATVVVQGCATTVAYKPEYIQQESVQPSGRIHGRALVYMDSSDATYTFKGTPRSFNGGARTLIMPLGSMTQQIAKSAFGDFFSGGVDIADSLTHIQDYRAVVQPRVYSFIYGYNSLKNLGLAITPDIELTLGVKLLDGAGHVVWDKSYNSGKVKAATYWATLKPEERINKVTHQQIYKLLRQAATDIRGYLEAHPAGAPM